MSDDIELPWKKSKSGNVYCILNNAPNEIRFNLPMEDNHVIKIGEFSYKVRVFDDNVLVFRENPNENKRISYCKICAQNGFPNIPIKWQKSDGKWILLITLTKVNRMHICAHDMTNDRKRRINLSSNARKASDIRVINNDDIQRAARRHDHLLSLLNEDEISLLAKPKIAATVQVSTTLWTREKLIDMIYLDLTQVNIKIEHNGETLLIPKYSEQIIDHNLQKYQSIDQHLN